MDTGQGSDKGPAERSPKSKARSLSDGGGTPGTKLSPSPLILEASRRTSKDDSALGDSPAPVTPRRPDFAGSLRGLSLQMPPRDLSPAQQQQQYGSPAKPTPLSPKLDHSQIYASPTSLLPRRSRGLDFSRAATSLHHSTLAEQSSPDSSPIIGAGGRAMNIPGRRGGDFGATESTTSLWSVMGNSERMQMSSSLGSTHHHPIVSDSSSSSDLDDDLMDEDEDMGAYITTPQVDKTIGGPVGNGTGAGWPAGSPAVNSLLSFQQRQRPRKQLNKKKPIPVGGPPPNLLSKSPPSGMAGKEGHARRESISWAANQLHISGNESDENMGNVDGINAHQLTPGREARGALARRVNHRRANLFPKTKSLARIRAALAEEGAPVESEVRREAEVIRQVRESDPIESLEARIPAPISISTTAQSSPHLPHIDNIDEMGDESMAIDPNPLSSSFKAQAIRNSKGKDFWKHFNDASRISTTPPPQPSLPRGSSTMSTDDMSVDSQFIAPPHSSSSAFFPMTSSSSGGETPQPTAGAPFANAPPSAAEITRRINNKRRRDDDAFDPVSFKRRAVSPGMSVHNSPVMQSPLQRDMPWGSRPGSNGGDRGGSGAPSENGSQGPAQSQGERSQSQGGGTRPHGGNKGRVGYQGMVDTHDGITRLSIE